jgi:secondary thiamine-phosphate synthase enzyme
MVRFSIQTQGFVDIKNITGEIQKIVESSGVKHGLASIFITATTASLLVNEDEPGLLNDIKKMIEKLIPADKPYEHNRLNGDGNAHAHLRSMLFRHHLVLPVEEGKLVLGKWQSILLIDFDNKPRLRELVVIVQ